MTSERPRVGIIAGAGRTTMMVDALARLVAADIPAVPLELNRLVRSRELPPPVDFMLREPREPRYCDWKDRKKPRPNPKRDRQRAQKQARKRNRRKR